MTPARARLVWMLGLAGWAIALAAALCLGGCAAATPAVAPRPVPRAGDVAAVRQLDVAARGHVVAAQAAAITAGDAAGRALRAVDEARRLALALPAPAPAQVAALDEARTETVAALAALDRTRAEHAAAIEQLLESERRAMAAEAANAKLEAAAADLARAEASLIAQLKAARAEAHAERMKYYRSLWLGHPVVLGCGIFAGFALCLFSRLGRRVAGVAGRVGLRTAVHVATGL